MTDRLHFASAGAVRRARVTASVTIQVHHDDLVSRIAGNRPAAILGLADDLDLEERAEHVEQLLRDVEAYLEALMKDTAYCANVRINAPAVLGCLSDKRADIVGALLNAADELRGAAR